MASSQPLASFCRHPLLFSQKPVTSTFDNRLRRRSKLEGVLLIVSSSFRSWSLSTKDAAPSLPFHRNKSTIMVRFIIPPLLWCCKNSGRPPPPSSLLMEGVLRQAFVRDVCIFDLFELWDALAHFESEWRFEYCGCLYGTEHCLV